MTSPMKTVISIARNIGEVDMCASGASDSGKKIDACIAV